MHEHEDELPEHATRWFGESWGAPVCREDNHDPIPVGHLCQACRLAIKEGDTGFLVYHLDYAKGYGEFMPWHQRCLIESIIPDEVLVAARAVKKKRAK